MQALTCLKTNFPSRLSRVVGQDQKAVRQLSANFKSIALPSVAFQSINLDAVADVHCGGASNVSERGVQGHA